MPADGQRAAAPRTVAEVLAAELARRGTRRVWGVPGGDGSLDLIAAMPRFGLSFLLARHEGAAAMAAVAEAELTGAPGAVLTTKGPGLANALNGLACASLERAPLLLVSDGFGAGELGWVTHQVFDQRAASAPFVAGHGHGEDAAEIAALLDRAQAERRPVHLDLAGAAARRGASPAAPCAPLPCPVAETGDPALLLRRARRPVILAGLEAATAEAAAALTALAEALAAPVLVTYKAKGAIPDTHPLFAGLFTGGALEARLVGAADLILAAGLDPVELIPQPWRYAAPVIEIAQAPFPVRYVTPAAALHGPPSGGLARLAGAARASDWTAAGIAAHRAAMREALAWRAEGGVSPPEVVTLARQAARHAGRRPRATVDAGAHMFAATAFWECAAPRDLLISNGLASMGFALPAAIAAALHEPARGAVCFTGDGGLMMVAGELATAVEAGAPVVVIVLNDGALSLIDIKQQQRQLPPAGVRWARADFARVAEGFGMRGFTARDPAGYRAALGAAFAGGGPALVDVHVDPAGYAAQLRALRG